ncbi:MAG: hypothetical protein FVQ83_00070 [Chloroflexi bacterium]|nr:hypothetical protein [Chloroflexota bacterium]
MSRLCIHSLGGFCTLAMPCGLLTGGALTAGFIARDRFDNEKMRTAAALYTTIQLTKAHPETTGSVNCIEITNVSFQTLGGRLRYIQEGKGRMCGRLHLRWAPKAHDLIDNALTEFSKHEKPKGCENCAVQTLKKTVSAAGMREEDTVLAAGLAGGVGLLGNVCGTLAAGVFAISVNHYQGQTNNKRDSKIRGALQEISGHGRKDSGTQLRLAFKGQFGSELCNQIIQREFQSIVDHSEFIEQGGCKDVIDFTAEWVEQYLS